MATRTQHIFTDLPGSLALLNSYIVVHKNFLTLTVLMKKAQLMVSSMGKLEESEVIHL